MLDLASGRYYILPINPSGTAGLPVGGFTDKSPSPVTVGGGDRLWTVTQLDDGNYTLTLDQFGPRPTEISGGDVVVDLDGTAQEWRISPRRGGTYTIEIADLIGWPIRAWSVANTNPDTEVTIVAYEFPENVQRWIFQLFDE